jgi:MoaA/NifB/PqqE/SkfB family radical SAM enzyme
VSEYVQRVKRPIKPIAPRLGQLDIELTERCNNDCIHCCINRPANDAVARAGEVTTEQVKDILQQAVGLGCLQVRFTGGEPLLRPDFEELYLFARRLGLKVLLFTNGRLITPHLADLFARIPPLATMEITVYGMHAESYEAVTRAPGSFAQFWRGVNLLLAYGVPFVVKSALLPQNRQEIGEFEAWAKTIPWMDKRPSYSMFFDLRSRRDSVSKNRQIESLRVSPQDGLAMLTGDEARYRQEMAEFASKFMGPPGDQLFDCGAGCGICVDSYGRAQPCMGVRAPELTCGVAGADGHSSLQDAKDQFCRLRELRATNPHYLRRCAVCFLKGLCEQCPGKSWVEDGTLDAPVEYLCDVAHVQARYLGWLGENEQGWQVIDWRERIKLLSVNGER